MLILRISIKRNIVLHGCEIVIMKKDDLLSSFAVILLLFTALIDWNISSWLILVAVVMIFTGWYLRKD